MIKTKEDLIEYIAADLSYFYSIKDTSAKVFKSFISKDLDYVVSRFQIKLRKSEYYMNVCNDTSLNVLKRKLLRLFYFFNKIKLNKLEQKLGLEIHENCFGKGLTIYHPYGIVVHPNAKIGENCKLHGCNCIGNKGEDNSNPPIIGNNIDIGFGAMVLGEILISDNAVIGAGAVVVNSILEENKTVVGIPAR